MKNLPIGINTLAKIRADNAVYIDKTALISSLTQTTGAYFLARPRRFGKSLLVDTLKELFEGNRGLFAGLYIEDKWDWDKQWPVIKIDFADGVVQSRTELDKRICNILQENAQRLRLECDWQAMDIAGCLGHLIRQAHARYSNRVIILVDEYDKPILDNIDQPQRAAEVREGLKNLYSVMKGQDAFIQFIFMTGVTQFSKVSLFSGLNQLNDITLNPKYATICGYTQHDLQTRFAEHLHGIDWQKLQQWYNGYNFRGEALYNPYDILLFIANGQEYNPYWFESGNPTFLVKLFQQQRYFLPNLEQIDVGREILDSFEVESIHPVTLLFQSGYLTINRVYEKRSQQRYQLTIPNLEVRYALYNGLIDGYTEVALQRNRLQDALYDTLSAGNLPELIATLTRLFASIPWRNFTHNELADSEGYFASVLYAFFASLNAVIIPEDITNHGQADLTIQLAGYTYVLEIKVDSSATPAQQGEENSALKQIQSKHYSQKYQGSGKGVFELGLVFSKVERNLAQADWIAC